MASKTKNKNVHIDSEVSESVEEYDGWHDAEIDLSKSPRRLLKIFRSKKSPKPVAGHSSPLGWFVDQDACGEALEKIDQWNRLLQDGVNPGALASELFESAKNSIERVNSQVDSQPLATISDSILLLGIAQSLRAVVGHCDFSQWTELVSRLLEVAQKAESNVRLAPPVYQLLAIELPLTIYFQLSEIEDNQQHANRCCKKMSMALDDMLDADGWPHARYFDDFGLLSSSWIRCGLIFRKMKLDLNDDAGVRLEWVVRQVIRLLRPDGTLAFSTGKPRPIDSSLRYSLGKLSSSSKDKKILKLIDEKTSVFPKKKLPPTSCISDWAASAALRSHWGSHSPRVSVDFSSTEGLAGLRGEVGRSQQLISGVMMPEVSINGVSASPAGEFDLVCEESDQDVEYMELELRLAGNTTLTRQILLSRDEEFLLIADSVLPAMASRIDYRCRYPLADGILGMRESENREVYLRTSEIQSLVLPLALPEWKTGMTDDRLEFKDSMLELVQSIDGFGLCAPLFFDLNPQRSRKKRTWRQLTVAEDLVPVPCDVACAYRIQLDEQQWFFYRAIANRGNRTVLGENFIGEFMFNRFEKNGKVTSLIVI